jgi:hypothetical protein
VRRGAPHAAHRLPRGGAGGGRGGRPAMMSSSFFTMIGLLTLLG